MGLALLIVFEDFFMARKPRVRARSGVYHVLMQGVRHGECDDGTHSGGLRALL